MKQYLPTDVLIVTSFLYRADTFCEADLIDLFQEEYGEGDVYHHSYFPMKEYYSQEMGTTDGLSRFFIFSHKTFPRNILVEAKKWATAKEDHFSVEERRTVNIDVGIVALEHVVLATHKPYSHRPYLYDGVYQELTLLYKKGNYHSLEWTYPDYAHPHVLTHNNGLLRRGMS
jgi:hypothetical protein